VRPRTRLRGGPLALLVAVLAGCGGDAAQPVRFWALGREGEVVQRLMADFTRRNPGIAVKVQQIPWTAAHEKLLTAFVGDASPDLAQVGNTWLPEFAALRAIEDLSPHLDNGTVVRADNFFPGVWATNTIAGRVLGVPWYVDTRVLFYRKDILAQAGIVEPPRTWDEWRGAMERIKRTVGPDRFAILLPVDEWAQLVVLAMEAGSPLLRDGDRFGAFRGPEFRRALEFYVALFSDRLAPALDRNQVANLYQQFAEGHFAMYITGPWNLGEFRRRLPAALQDGWATAPLAAVCAEDWPGISLAGGSSLVLFRSSRRKDAGWKIIEYLSEPAQQVAFYHATGDLPAHRGAWEDPSLAGDSRTRAFFTQLAHVRPVPKIPEWEQIAQRTAELAEQALRGRMSIDEAVTALDRDVDRMLEKRRWLLVRASRVRP